MQSPWICKIRVFAVKFPLTSLALSSTQMHLKPPAVIIVIGSRVIRLNFQYKFFVLAQQIIIATGK